MYLLDTDTCIYIINKKRSEALEKINKLNPSIIKISSITVAEMEYGASKSKNRDKNKFALKKFLSPFEIIDFDSTDAEIYGVIRAELERKGMIIGPYDLQLAAQAMRRDYIFVTNNINEFRRIDGLKLENWIKKA